MNSIKLVFSFILVSILCIDGLAAQDLEPRAINNLPVGTNFLLAGYVYADGNILLDPALPIDGLDAKLNTFIVAYVRSIDFFGLSAKIDAVLPYVLGDWNGNVIGLPDRLSHDGFGDLRLRFSFNFLNSPAMNPSEFTQYNRSTISGFSLQIIVPTGQYDPAELLNLGSNRWTFKPQWGISKRYNKWTIEGYTSIWVFTTNSNYLNGNELKQKPLYTAKFHVIRDLPKSMWVAVNIGYGIGGRAIVNGTAKDTQISGMRFGLHYVVPFSLKHSIKFGYASGIRFQKGSDFDAVTLTYQYRWNKSVKEYIKSKETK